MDPVMTTTLIGLGSKAIEALESEARNFLDAVVKPSAGAVSGLVTDKVNAWRYRNLIQIVVNAKRRLDEAGLSPQEVPLKIIHPLLEAASLEDSPDIQKMWENLLTNATDPTAPVAISPSFVSVLNELRGADARFLDTVYEDFRQKVDLRQKSGMGANAQEIKYGRRELLMFFVKTGLSRTQELANMAIELHSKDSEVDADLRDFDFMMSFIQRLGVLEEQTHIPPVQVNGNPLYSAPMVNLRMHYTYSFTRFGEYFIRACRRETQAKATTPAVRAS